MALPGDALVHDRADILGVRLSAINLDDAVGLIESWIKNRKRTFVCVTGAHGIIESRRDDELRAIHNAAGMVTPDGMPLVWLARLLGKSRTRRVYGPDLMSRLIAVSAERGYSSFFYGGADGVAETLRARLQTQHPGLTVSGTFCPPFRAMTDAEDRDVVRRINAARPDIVWIGLSTPKQERWMAAHQDRIDAPIMIGVGAAFDFLAGTKRQAPVLMQQLGLEWAFRLLSEPRRLWRRYVRIVPLFAILAMTELVRQRAAKFALPRSSKSLAAR
jgi:N-acetylglucosaminyldiphosphoundecaprenol N-acetyl-beta-D-mannosaminyltransferase